MPASASQHPQPASGPKKAPGREEVATLHPAAVRLGLAPGMRVPGGEGEQKESWPQLGLGTGLLGGFWRLPCHIPGTALLSVQGWGPRGINAVSALERGCTHFLLPQAIKDMNLNPVSPFCSNLCQPDCSFPEVITWLHLGRFSRHHQDTYWCEAVPLPQQKVARGLLQQMLLVFLSLLLAHGSARLAGVQLT